VLTDEYNEPKGLGGCLLLPALGLFLTPLTLLAVLLRDYLPIFSTGSWWNLTTSTSPQYEPLRAVLLIFEIVGNLGFILFAVVLLIHLVRRSIRFPKLMILYLVANVLFVLCDTLAGVLISLPGGDLTFTSARAILRPLIVAAVWIPYFRYSQRVRNTFTVLA